MTPQIALLVAMEARSTDVAREASARDYKAPRRNRGGHSGPQPADRPLPVPGTDPLRTGGLTRQWCRASATTLHP